MNEMNYFIPFTFDTGALDDRIVVCPHDFLIDRLTFTLVTNREIDEFRIKIANITRVKELSDDWLFTSSFQASAKQVFRLPSPWLVKAGERIKVSADCDIPQEETSYSDFQIVLGGTAFPNKLTEIPDSEAFIYSFNTLIGQVGTSAMNRQVISNNLTNSVVKSPLLVDFDLTGITIGDRTTYSGAAWAYSLQIFDRSTNKQLFGGNLIQSTCAGGDNTASLQSIGASVPSGLPAHDVAQFNMIENRVMQPLARFKMGMVLGILLSCNPLYLTSSTWQGETQFQPVNVCLIGSKQYET